MVRVRELKIGAFNPLWAGGKRVGFKNFVSTDNILMTTLTSVIRFHSASRLVGERGSELASTW